jgi:hypothetical protein
MRRMVSKSARSKSVPSKRIVPPTMRPGGDGMSRRIESELTVFPDPDSPTSPRISPGRTKNEMSSMTRWTPWSVSNSTVRPSTARSASSGAVDAAVSGAAPTGCAVATRVMPDLPLRRRRTVSTLNASRNPSPSRLNASTVSAIATPGYTTCHGWTKIFSNPSLIMMPQLDFGGWIPMPRKLSVASASRTEPRASDAATITGDATFGSTRATRSHHGLDPIDCEASMKVSSRTARVCARISRVKPGMNTIVRAIMAFVRPGPRTPAIASARISAGIERIASITRMRVLSNHPPM